MAKLRAVCIRCGEFKRDSLKACGNCGFHPAAPKERAESLMLSECFDLGEEVVGLARGELERTSATIKAGDAYHFDAAEVSRVTGLYLQAQSITGRRLLVDGVKWLAPPILLVILFYVVIRV